MADPTAPHDPQTLDTPPPSAPPPPPAPKSQSAPPPTSKSPPPPPSTSPPPPSPPPSPHPALPARPPSPAPAPAPAVELSTSATPDSVADQGIVDMDIFQQVLDLDEDTTHDFSRGMAWAYFTQAEDIFERMDEALLRRDLAQLSTLGHFLKGSSAALGLSKVQASCEKIQHYGQQRDEEADKSLTVEGALARITALLSQVNKEHFAAEAWLRNWYDENADPEDGDPDSPRF